MAAAKARRLKPSSRKRTTHAKPRRRSPQKSAPARQLATRAEVIPPVPTTLLIARPHQVPFASVLYLYGVSRIPSYGLDQVAVLPEPAGIDGHAPIEAWIFGNFQCWLSRVPRAEFVDRLHQRMEDLDWLSQTSIRHQRAVTAIAHHTTILPARFGTVYLSERSLAEDLRKRANALESDLARITEADEWSLKLFAIPQRRSATEMSMGRLQRERLELLPQQQLEQDIQRLTAELSKVVVAMTDGRRRSVAGVRPNLEWQISLLVRRNRKEKLQAVLERFGKRWEGRRRIECTGPWPPFAFARLDTARKANHEDAPTIDGSSSAKSGKNARPKSAKQNHTAKKHTKPNRMKRGSAKRRR